LQAHRAHQCCSGTDRYQGHWFAIDGELPSPLAPAAQQPGTCMRHRLTNALLAVVAVLLFALVAQPYANRFLAGPSEPRTIAPRADLTDLERASVELFDAIAPSVVQVAVLPPLELEIRLSVRPSSGPVRDSYGIVSATSSLTTMSSRGPAGSPYGLRAVRYCPRGWLVGRRTTISPF
jgi:hypothetical protein